MKRALQSNLGWLAPLLALAVAAVLFDQEASCRLAAYTQARPQLLHLATLVTDWGNYAFYVGFALALAVGLLRGDRALVKLGLAYFLTLLVFSFLLTRLVKIGVGRPRPWIGAEAQLGCRPLTLDARYHSFPSGHTSDAFAAIVPALRWLPPGAAGTLLRSGVFLLALLVSLSRVMLSQHYLTDVVAGAVLAVGGGWAVAWGLERWLPSPEGEGQ